VYSVFRTHLELEITTSRGGTKPYCRLFVSFSFIKFNVDAGEPVNVLAPIMNLLVDKAISAVNWVTEMTEPSDYFDKMVIRLVAVLDRVNPILVLKILG
jgi:hypothetical protein